MDESKLRELAIEQVCPYTKKPETPYERMMVRFLVRFGLLILDAAEQAAAPDRSTAAEGEGESQKHGR